MEAITSIELQVRARPEPATMDCLAEPEALDGQAEETELAEDLVERFNVPDAMPAAWWGWRLPR